MAKEPKPLNRGAGLLKKKLDKARVKNADGRARAKATPKSGGTLTERVKQAAKSGPVKRGLPAIYDNGKRAIVKTTGKDLVKSGGRDIVRAEPRSVTKYQPRGGGPRVAGGGIGGTVARGLFRGIGGPATMLVSMTTPTGDGQEDKPRGPLMKGNAAAGGNRRQAAATYTKSYDKPARATFSDKGVRRPTAPIGSGAPSADKEKTKAFAALRQGTVKKAPPKASPKAAPKPTFRGNWQNAAPTEMQSRLGRRLKRGERMSKDR